MALLTSAVWVESKITDIILIFFFSFYIFVSLTLNMAVSKYEHIQNVPSCEHHSILP